MIKQIKYFQAIVRCKNFTKAAEECFISQSAISQQLQALEKELGVILLHREGRKFSLTPAGEFFYRKSLVLVNDFDRICRETLKVASGREQKISIGYLRHYNKLALTKTIAQFNEKYPEINIHLMQGTHEELYHLIRDGKVDLIISDLRRNPSDHYVNFFLLDEYFYAELPIKNPLAQLDSITVDDLKNTPIILPVPSSERYNEEIFYRDYLGVKSDFIFVENLEDAHLMVIANRGYFPITFSEIPQSTEFVKYVPILHNSEPICKKYFVFWRVESSNHYIEDFAKILKAELDFKLQSAKSNI